LLTNTTQHKNKNYFTRKMARHITPLSPDS